MRYAILTFLLLYSNLAYGGVEEIMDATCKISMGGFNGTATVFREDGEYLWAIGAGHVGSPKTDGFVSFYHDGQESEKFPMTVVWRVWDNKQNTNDIAFYKFKKPGFRIKPIPLAPKNYEVKLGQVVLSHGHAYGVWPSTWRGKVVRVADSNQIGFQPCPAIGRSGSGLFNREGTMIVGIVVMSYNADQGTAVPLAKIYELLPNAK